MGYRRVQEVKYIDFILEVNAFGKYLQASFLSLKNENTDLFG